MESKAQPPDPWKCNKCGHSGEQIFTWDGNCLVCEDEEGTEDSLEWREHDYEHQERIDIL